MISPGIRELVEGLVDAVGAVAPRRVALSPVEAASAIGVSRDFFDEHVLPELKVVRRGRLVLVPIVELTRWLERSAELTLEVRR